jgi:hypothetical protein
MVEFEIINQIIEALLAKIETKDQEIGRLLVHDEFTESDSRINLWAIRYSVRDLKEVAISDFEEYPYETKITYASPDFFLKVLHGENVPYWQVVTVNRVLSNCDIVFDPNGKMQEWINQISNIEWNPETIELKRQTTQMLLERVENRIREDMLADAYIWLIKAAEEAICVPLMLNDAFKIGTASLMLDALRELDIEVYTFFSNLLRISFFSPEKLDDARKELEKLADHLYKTNIKTDREMWILAAFVSINESERRLQQSLEMKDAAIGRKLFEAAIGELWQAYFLVAQNPRIEVKLDPYVVGSFWNWFGFPDLDETWLIKQISKIKDLVTLE